MYLRPVGKLFMAGRYVVHQCRALTRAEVHSPFLFDLTEQVLNDSRHFYAFDEIEYRRDLLLAANEMLQIEDHGAGSHSLSGNSRKVSDIARTSLITPRFGQHLFRLATFLQPTTILEMGTSLGISAAYLAKGAPQARMVTLEGSPAIADVARQQLQALGLDQVEVRIGEFSHTLPAALESLRSVDLAFIDGNHRYEPTVQYFEALKPYLHDGSVIVFDDIHWSRGMEKAWNTIRRDPRVTVSVDLFYKGIVSFRTAFREPVHMHLRA